MQKILSKGGDRNNIYVTKTKAIAFWRFYKEASGKK